MGTMEITYFVGNGFDMMYGLKTSYNQFYDYMMKEFSKDKITNNFFYNQIKADVKKWSDFEWMIGLSTKSDEEIEEFLISNGQFTKTNLKKEPFNKNHFLDSLEEFQEDFEEYLKLQENEALIPNLEDSLVSFLTELDDGLFRRVSRILTPEGSPATITINFLQFNYTSILDQAINTINWDVVKNSFCEIFKLDQSYDIKFYLGENIHVHEKLGSGSFLGVNDLYQINSNLFTETELNYLIKPRLIEEYDQFKLLKLDLTIDRTSLFIIFGMSLGETDLRWWKKILQRIMASNALVVLHRFDLSLNFTKARPRKYLEIMESTTNMLLKHNKGLISATERRKVIPLINSKNLFVDHNYKKIKV